MYVSVYIYQYEYACVYIYTHKDIYIVWGWCHKVCRAIDNRYDKYVCLYIYVNMGVCVCIHTDIYIAVGRCHGACTYKYVCVHIYIHRDTYIAVGRCHEMHRAIEHMGWLWLVGSIELFVSFAKEPYKRDDILQKRPMILSILLIVATP